MAAALAVNGTGDLYTVKKDPFPFLQSLLLSPKEGSERVLKGF